jgi:hypothetical protein
MYNFKDLTKDNMTSVHFLLESFVYLVPSMVGIFVLTIQSNYLPIRTLR